MLCFFSFSITTRGEGDCQMWECYGYPLNLLYNHNHYHYHHYHHHYHYYHYARASNRYCALLTND